ncbi:MAG: TlpA disulfide reductase family protein [Ilumatobacteraceae bacterium]
MAVNIKVLIGSLSVAAIVSITGGYALSQSNDSGSTAPVDDTVTITSNGVYSEPGLPLNGQVEGDRLPAIDLSDSDGNLISTSDLLGQPLVINVWSSDCVPCQKELPAFAAMHAEFGDDVRFVGINSGRDSIAEAKSFAAKYGVNYESFKDPNGDFIAQLKVTALPYTLFIAADGTIVAQKGVALSQDTIRSTINDALLS